MHHHPSWYGSGFDFPLGYGTAPDKDPTYDMKLKAGIGAGLAFLYRTVWGCFFKEFQKVNLNTKIFHGNVSYMDPDYFHDWSFPYRQNVTNPTGFGSTTVCIIICILKLAMQLLDFSG